MEDFTPTEEMEPQFKCDCCDVMTDYDDMELVMGMLICDFCVQAAEDHQPCNGCEECTCG